MVTVIFFIAALTTIVGSLGVVSARNPVHSAMFLVMSLMSIAVHYVLLGADLAAAVQVIVYASAIVILFLFVIMLLGVDRPDVRADDYFSRQRVVSIAVAVMFGATLLLIGGTRWASGARTVSGPLSEEGFSNVELVARTLFTKYVWVFELTAILLVGAVIGAVLIARRFNETEELLDEITPDPILDSSEME